MSQQKSKRIRIQILNPASGCGHTSLAHARRYVARGMAEWVEGAIRFFPKLPTALLAVDPRESADFRPSDSGYGIARYPLPMMTSGARFPALARAGAGL